MYNRGFATVLMLAVVGCSGERFSNLKQPSTVQVGGVVKMDGLPLANASVQFIPLPSTPGIGSQGYTNAAGEFELTTPRGRKSVVRGAPEGKYRVTVTKYVKLDLQHAQGNSDEHTTLVGAIDQMPPLYSNPEMTILEAEVVRDGAPIVLELVKHPSAPDTESVSVVTSR